MVKVMKQKNNIECSEPNEYNENEDSLYNRNETYTKFSINGEINKLMKEWYKKRINELRDKENVGI